MSIANLRQMKLFLGFVRWAMGEKCCCLRIRPPTKRNQQPAPDCSMIQIGKIFALSLSLGSQQNPNTPSKNAIGHELHFASARLMGLSWSGSWSQQDPNFPSKTANGHELHFVSARLMGLSWSGSWSWSWPWPWACLGLGFYLGLNLGLGLGLVLVWGSWAWPCLGLGLGLGLRRALQGTSAREEPW